MIGNFQSLQSLNLGIINSDSFDVCFYKLFYKVSTNT